MTQSNVFCGCDTMNYCGWITNGFEKFFEKSRILSRIYREYFHQHHHTKMAYIMLESKSYFTSSARWQGRKFLMSFVYTNIIKKMSGQIHSIKVQAFGATSEAAQHYVLWICHQIQERRGDNALDLIKWGW